MSEILRKLEQFSEKLVLVIGDVMLDHYLFGDVHRISPEAPVPVVHLTGSDNRLGGAANVAANIRAMGAACAIAGRIAKDQAGKDLKDKLEQWKIEHSLIFEDGTVTTRKSRVMNHEHQLLRIDDEDISPSEPDIQDRCCAQIELFMESRHPDMIILQDYNKGFITIRLIERILAKARKLQIPVAVDPKENNFFAYNGVQIFKPNLRESEHAIQQKIGTDIQAISKAANILKERLNADIIIMTLASKGMYILSEASESHFPAMERKVSDVSGAGDSVIAAISLGFCSAFNDEELGLIGNMAGGQVCEFPGVVQIDFDTLKIELGRHSHKKNKLFMDD